MMSSMSLQMIDEALIILWLLNTQSKASFVAISPVPMKDVASIEYPQLTNALLIYSSMLDMYSWWNHFASAK